MNRIYQGRVSSVEMTESDNSISHFDRSALSNEIQSPLWKHHCVFQDAVNYYIFALAAVAGDTAGKSNRVLADLVRQVDNSWESFPRAVVGQVVKPRSIRDSLADWLPVKGKGFKEAKAIILEGNTASNEANELSLELLLERCGGESSIQQNGRGYLPHFTVSSGDRSYDYSKQAIEGAAGKQRLADVLHGEVELDRLKQIASEMELGWLVKVSDGKFYTFEESKERLVEAFDYLIEKFEQPEGSRIEDFLALYPETVGTLKTFKEQVPNLSEPFEIPRNKKASKDLTFAALCFQFFPDVLTAAILKLSVAAPASSDASRNDIGKYTSLGDDPIKLARGSNGYIFRAFTALPSWNPASPGEPVWKEFDIAAFKEALTSFNQFKQKTIEREENRVFLEGLIAHLLGRPVKGWKMKKNESGEAVEIPAPLDGNLFTVAREIEAELTEDLNESEVGELEINRYGEAEFEFKRGEWKISKASLRGFRDISEKWNRLHSKQNGKPSISELEQIVKEFQKVEKNRASLGSVPLFLRLCQERFWSLWVNGRDGENNSFLYRMCEFHQWIMEYQRSKELINLTPAEPRFSRRLFRFSDIRDAVGKPDFLNDGANRSCIEVGIAHKTDSGSYKPKRIKLHYSAPRLHRDQLLGGEESRWLQPMAQALGYSVDPESGFQSAVGLMPDYSSSGELRMLLNFAKSLNSDPLQKHIGKSDRWKAQFNGIKGKNLHLHWPATAKEANKKNAWWENPTIIKDGFTVLSTDLGQRTAGAWSLLQISNSRPDTKRPVREIGFDGKNKWYAEVINKGMFRLPGEDQKVWNPSSNSDKPETEYYGKAGRHASADEYKQALDLANELLADDPANWLGSDAQEKSFPEQNDSLIALANRRLTRLNTFHRWSCFNPDRAEISSRREKVIEAMIAELGHWQDAEIKSWADFAAAGDWETFRKLSGDAFLRYRSGLQDSLEKIANRVAPLKHRSWIWKRVGGEYGQLCDEGSKPEITPKIRGQRGLALRRIDQLEGLRKLFLRYNRSFDRIAGQPAKFGFSDRGRQSGEPCRILLEKIDRLKEQRINQTAHLILAKALGVRLKQFKKPKEERNQADIHGEYEKIPGREPVDMIVIENLDRYLTSQGRAPSENSRLMKWAHRSVRDKIKMLSEEPFGIPVVEAAASYSSRFCAVKAVPGMRCFETSSLPQYLKTQFEKKAKGPKKLGQPSPGVYSSLIKQFEELEKCNSGRNKPKTLLLPQPGGPLFLGLGECKPFQADINAAINIGLRAVCNPECLDIIHKVRSEVKRGIIKPVRANAREKAAFTTKTKIELDGAVSDKLSKASNPNFFFNSAECINLERAVIEVGDSRIPLSSGIGTWATVNQQIPSQIVEINLKRLEQYCGKKILLQVDDDYDNEKIEM